ncbi:hypothetical protein [Qipengyuania marisflavi]|uniref:Circumsporozoite protein n=1 Tax=Qipengyuania marisflavi TaxID=2486356 RepID=A0A5S3PRE6_9SPHN|nr:hypothetical protein [Qipengyuania marisflavi]TMM46155.1 hypothetical protein FEV51_12010 [Qipengyuania marisflavi]
MKKFMIPALAAGLALAACDSPDAVVVDETAGTDGTVATTTAPAPNATETVVVDDTGMAPAEGNNVTIDGKDVDATIGEDGVKAKIKID